MNGSYSYAVAFLSNRVDGYPFKNDFGLAELGLNHTAGYLVEVREKQMTTNRPLQTSVFNCHWYVRMLRNYMLPLTFQMCAESQRMYMAQTLHNHNRESDSCSCQSQR